MTSLHTDPPNEFDDRHRRGPRRPLFLLGAAAILVLLGGWIYVLFVYDPGLLIDELPDRRFPDAAEEICAAAVDRLEELPPAMEAGSATERADVVERSNAILRDMIDRLEPQAPTEPENVRAGVAEWIADWRVYIGNRERYVDNLRADPEARFLESPKGSDTKGITRAIDGFAEVNRMNSCTTPDDVS